MSEPMPMLKIRTDCIVLATGVKIVPADYVSIRAPRDGCECDVCQENRDRWPWSLPVILGGPANGR